MTYPNLSKNRLKFLQSLQSKKFRIQENMFVVEGVRLCEEAVRTDQSILEAIVIDDYENQSRLLELVSQFESKNIPIQIATEHQLQKIADTKSPQGIALLLKKPFPKPRSYSPGLYLALDNLNDPGNVGTIIRTAAWFGTRGVLMNKDCVELYNPKVVRSTMGAIFTIPVYENIDFTIEFLSLKENGFRVIGTAMGTENSLQNFLSTDKDVLVIGSEAFGLSESTREFIDEYVSIPQHGQGESLNAALASGICLYELTRKN